MLKETRKTSKHTPLPQISSRFGSLWRYVAPPGFFLKARCVQAESMGL
jgi:hypothetical protein